MLRVWITDSLTETILHKKIDRTLSLPLSRTTSPLTPSRSFFTSLSLSPPGFDWLTTWVILLRLRLSSVRESSPFIRCTVVISFPAKLSTRRWEKWPRPSTSLIWTSPNEHTLYSLFLCLLLSVSLSVCLSISLFLFLSVSLSVCLSPSLTLFLCLSLFHTWLPCRSKTSRFIRDSKLHIRLIL